MRNHVLAVLAILLGVSACADDEDDDDDVQCTVAMKSHDHASDDLVSLPPLAREPEGKARVTNRASSVAMDDRCSNGSRCVRIRFEGAALELPDALEPGLHDLSTIDARFCQWGVDVERRCVAVRGDIDVAASEQPCGDGACGRFIAFLRIDGGVTIGDDGEGAELHGGGVVVYEEWREEMCWQNPTGEGGGGCACTDGMGQAMSPMN